MEYSPCESYSEAPFQGSINGGAYHLKHIGKHISQGVSIRSHHVSHISRHLSEGVSKARTSSIGYLYLRRSGWVRILHIPHGIQSNMQTHLFSPLIPSVSLRIFHHWFSSPFLMLMIVSKMPFQYHRLRHILP